MSVRCPVNDLSKTHKRYTAGHGSFRMRLGGFGFYARLAKLIVIGLCYEFLSLTRLLHQP